MLSSLGVRIPSPIMLHLCSFRDFEFRSFSPSFTTYTDIEKFMQRVNDTVLFPNKIQMHVYHNTTDRSLQYERVSPDLYKKRDIIQHVYFFHVNLENPMSPATTEEMMTSHLDLYMLMVPVKVDTEIKSVSRPYMIGSNRLHLNGMSPNEIRNVAFEDGTTISDNLYAIGLAPRLRKTLIEFIVKNGVMKKIREIMKKSMKAGTTTDLSMSDGMWQLQRPENWNSDVHWISPNEKKTQLAFMKVLKDGGIDDTLHALGTKLNFEGLSCYQLTFMAISKCSEGFIHFDTENTGNKAFTLLIPLLLKENSDPELEVQLGDTNEMVGLKYEYGTGILVGDKAVHAPTVFDYTRAEEMRVMAFVYVADINKSNVQEIMKNLTQNFPPASKKNFLKDAGNHWQA